MNFNLFHAEQNHIEQLFGLLELAKIASFSGCSVHIGLIKMASAYRARFSQQTSDESSNPEDGISDRSSETVGGDTDDENMSDRITNHAHLQSQHIQPDPPPLQLRNRVLMLTSRGVSYRYAKHD